MLSMAVGELISLVFMALAYGILTATEMIAGFLATHLIATYAAWTTLVVKEEVLPELFKEEAPIKKMTRQRLRRVA